MKKANDKRFVTGLIVLFFVISTLGFSIKHDNNVFAFIEDWNKETNIAIDKEIVENDLSECFTSYKVKTDSLSISRSNMYSIFSRINNESDLFTDYENSSYLIIEVSDEVGILATWEVIVFKLNPDSTSTLYYLGHKLNYITIINKNSYDYFKSKLIKADSLYSERTHDNWTLCNVASIITKVEKAEIKVFPVFGEKTKILSDEEIQKIKNQIPNFEKK